MGTALITIKMMPTSPDVNLDEIQELAKKVVEDNDGERVNFKTEPIAFGLNAVIVNFSLDESKSIDDIENPLKEIENVSSVSVIDFRRAFG